MKGELQKMENGEWKIKNYELPIFCHVTQWKNISARAAPVRRESG
jgi:hypothetical protein